MIDQIEMPTDSDEAIPLLIKHSGDLINAINYLLMRINRIEDRLNIGIKEEGKYEQEADL